MYSPWTRDGSRGADRRSHRTRRLGLVVQVQCLDNARWEKATCVRHPPPHPPPSPPSTESAPERVCFKRDPKLNAARAPAAGRRNLQARLMLLCQSRSAYDMYVVQ